MGRHKFEDQLKASLEKREIKPSEGSWEKLSSRLESEEKRSFPFWWIGIAATIVGAILIAGMVFYNNPVSETPVIVNSPSEIDIDTQNSEEPLISIENNEGIAEEEIKTEEENSIKKQFIKASVIQNTSIEIAEAEPSEEPSGEKEAVIANSNPNIMSTGKDNANMPSFTNEDIKFAAEVEAVLAELAEIEKSRNGVTEAEVDSLLSRAASQISENRQKKFSSEKIDAEALLWDVEMEMEHSFREKVFDALKEGYLRAKTAVANRNN